MRLNRQTLIFLAVCIIVIIAGLAISNLQQQTAEDSAATTVATTLFSGVNLTDVARLSVKDETTAGATIYVQQSDGAWGIESTTSEATGTLTQTTIDSAIGNLIQVKAESFPAEDLSVFGLDTPDLTAIFTTKDGKAQTLRLGSKNPQGNAYYALLNDDQATVYLVSGVGTITQLNTLANTPPFAADATAATTLTMPGPILANINPQEVTRLELRNNTTDEFLVLQRDAAGTWAVADATFAKDAATEPMLVNVLTGGLGALTGIDGFESDDLAAYGLDKPVYTFTITTGADQTHTLDVGSSERDGTRTNVKASDFTTIVVVKTEDLQPFLDAIQSPPYVIAEATAEATESAAAAEATESAEATAEATESSD